MPHPKLSAYITLLPTFGYAHFYYLPNDMGRNGLQMKIRYQKRTFAFDPLNIDRNIRLMLRYKVAVHIAFNGYFSCSSFWKCHLIFIFIFTEV